MANATRPPSDVVGISGSTNLYPLEPNSDGSINVDIQAGSAVIGAVTQSGTWTVQPGNTQNTTPWLTLIGTAGTDGSGTITSGGTAQNLFAGATPANGFSVFNPDAVEDIWISLSTTAAPNGTGSKLIKAGTGYESPPGMKPFHAISIVAATTGHKFTAEQW